MKFIAVFVLVGFRVLAVSVPPMPVLPYADTEVSTNVAFNSVRSDATSESPYGLNGLAPEGRDHLFAGSPLVDALAADGVAAFVFRRNVAVFAALYPDHRLRAFEAVPEDCKP